MHPTTMPTRNNSDTMHPLGKQGASPIPQKLPAAATNTTSLHTIVHKCGPNSPHQRPTNTALYITTCNSLPRCCSQGAPGFSRAGCSPPCLSAKLHSNCHTSSFAAVHAHLSSYPACLSCHPACWWLLLNILNIPNINIPNMNMPNIDIPNIIMRIPHNRVPTVLPDAIQSALPHAQGQQP